MVDVRGDVFYPDYHFRLEFDMVMKQLLPLSNPTFPVVTNYGHCLSQRSQ